jgi:hypothetical protein
MILLTPPSRSYVYLHRDGAVGVAHGLSHGLDHDPLQVLPDHDRCFLVAFDYHLVVDYGDKLRVARELTVTTVKFA